MAQKSTRGHDTSTEGRGAKNRDEKDVQDQLVDEALADIRRMMKADPLLAFRGTLTENQLLRKLARSNNRLAVILGLFLAIAIGAAYAGWQRDVEYRYFFLGESEAIEVSAYRYPPANPTRAYNFAKDIVTQFHTWTYQNYLDVFEDLRMKRRCTPEVIVNYYNALGDNGVFNAAERYSQRYESAVTGGRIEKELTIGPGQKGWEISFTLNEDIWGTTRPMSREWDIAIRVVQVPLSVSPSGLQCIQVDENYRERT